jgi:hypothetical protein
MDDKTIKYLIRRTNILEEKLNDLLSVEFEPTLSLYLDYCEESFVSFIVGLLKDYVSKDLPFEGVKEFSNFIVYTEVGEYIKNNYQTRIIEYYFHRKAYLLV